MSTKIEWVKNPDGSQGETWNPVSGCTKVSAGCKNCYAERQWPRLSASGQPYEGRAFTDVRCHCERLPQPLRWTKPRMVFVNSMSDLFHPDVPAHFIHDVFATMAAAKKHTFQILTKRPERMLEILTSPYFTNGKFEEDYEVDPLPLSNVWLGVSVENQGTANKRIPLLLLTPAAVRFVSAEPLLSPVILHNIFFKPFDVDWVIVGGESGHKARPMEASWALDIKDQCAEYNIPFFFKQGSMANWPDFRNPETFPPELRVKEIPNE